MELDVVRERVGAAALELGLEALERDLHQPQVLLGAPLGGQRRRRRLHIHAEFEHGHRVEHVRQVGGRQLHGRVVVRRQHEGADAMTRLDDARGLQARDCLADHRAAHRELLHHRDLGRQPVAGSQGTATDFFGQGRDDLLGQAAHGCLRGEEKGSGKLGRIMASLSRSSDVPNPGIIAANPGRISGSGPIWREISGNHGAITGVRRSPDLGSGQPEIIRRRNDSLSDKGIDFYVKSSLSDVLAWPCRKTCQTRESRMI